jgi:hypothetical protein
MISGVPLFRGKDTQDQLLHIMRILGTPSDQQLAKMVKDSVGIIVRFPSRRLLNSFLSAGDPT